MSLCISAFERSLTGNVKADSQEVAEKTYHMMRVGTVLAAAAVLEIVMIQS